MPVAGQPPGEQLERGEQARCGGRSRAAAPGSARAPRSTTRSGCVRSRARACRARRARSGPSAPARARGRPPPTARGVNSSGSPPGGPPVFVTSTSSGPRSASTRVDQPGGGVEVGRVVHVGPRADLGGGRLDALARARADRHGGALGGQRPGDAEADPARRAGYERDPALRGRDPSGSEGSLRACLRACSHAPRRSCSARSRPGSGCTAARPSAPQLRERARASCRRRCRPAPQPPARPAGRFQRPGAGRFARAAARRPIDIVTIVDDLLGARALDAPRRAICLDTRFAK